MVFGKTELFGDIADNVRVLGEEAKKKYLKLRLNLNFKDTKQIIN